MTFGIDYGCKPDKTVIVEYNSQREIVSTLQIVYVNAYRNYFGEVRFTKGYDTAEEATRMRSTNRGKSVRYINREPIRIILPA